MSSKRMIVKMQQGKVEQPKSGPEIESRVMDYLKSQGYQVTAKAKLRGKSGIEHTFDALAQRDDGFAVHTIAICITHGGDEEAEASTIFNFANKAYDVGIKERVLIAISSLHPETKHLAEKQWIKVIDEERVDRLLTRAPEQRVKSSKSFSFETKPQLLKSLADLGYRVEEKAKILGQSGVEYTFDILAYGNDTGVGRSLGIDFMGGEGEIGLEPISLFDTKAYDVGLDYKGIAISTGLSPEARQFAQHQGITVLELGKKAVARPAATEEEAFQPKKPIKLPIKLEKTEVPATKPQTKLLRQMPQPEAIQLIPEVLARRYQAIPLNITGNTLHVAMADPTNILALEAFSAQSRMRVKPMAASIKAIREAIDFNYKGYGEIEKQISHIPTPGETAGGMPDIDAAIDAPLAQALKLIIDEAVKARSSDIHVEPEERRLRVRYRIDGILQDTMSLPPEIHSALISRIKIMANMNIADHHHAQDGQFSVDASEREIDVRVATSPTVRGEMAVLRLLDKEMATLEMSGLGMLPDSLAKYESMLKVPYGMVLISGPTGAGKTTTLYAAINSLDTMGRNIVTIEDPAEYRFEDINQIQVNQQAGITFASGLRSILRLDPDVIMVGEIRDSETAQIAIQAALTGHLMLSSIHANDTVGALFRLVDLGVEPFLIASAVIGIVAQRMVRRICPDCTRLIEVPVAEQLAYEKEMGEKRAEFQYAAGCKTCAYTGYLGRTGIFEILAISDDIRRLIIGGAGSVEIRAQALKEGLASMMNDGMRKVKEGITTPSEVLRSAYSAE